MACNQRWTDYEVQAKRGQVAMDAMNILPHFRGKAIHDGMFCCIRGYLLTLRKQGIPRLDALTSLFMGDPISPDFSAE